MHGLLAIQLDVITDNIGRTMLWTHVTRVKFLTFTNANLQSYFIVELDDSGTGMEFFCMYPLSWC